MNRKRRLFRYFQEHVTIEDDAIQQIKSYPAKQISLMGGVKSWYVDCCAATYDQLKAGIAYAGYKYPDSDSVWTKAIEACKSVTADKLYSYGY